MRNTDFSKPVDTDKSFSLNAHDRLRLETWGSYSIM